MPSLDTLQYGCIVAVARVTDIRPAVRSKWFDRPKRGETNYGWIIKNVRQLKRPIPCKGALGLWNVPPAALRQIKVQLSNPSLE
jgi:hypothetical protein